MNDQLQKALTELANKLGTSVEYLWKVLIMQAKIEAIEDMSLCVFTIIFAFIMVNRHLKFNKKSKGDHWESSYYDKNETSGPIMIVLSLVWVAFFIACWVFMADMINAFVNPQYWALQQILKR